MYIYGKDSSLSVRGVKKKRRDENPQSAVNI